MKSTVPVGTGEKVRAALDARGLGHIGYASCPEFLAEGTAVQDFMQSDRVVVGSFEDADGDARRGAARAARRAGRADGRPSAEMVKLAANAYLATRDQLHQRDRERLRARRRRRRAGRAGHGPRPPDRHRTTCAPGSATAARCFPKDISFLKLLAGNSGYHFHLVTAVMEVNELQMRRVGGEAPEAPRRAARQADRAARARVQAEHRRHARGAEPRARRRGCSPRAPRSSPGTRSPTRSGVLRGSTSRDTVPRPFAAPTRRWSSPSGRSCATLPVAELRDTMRTPLVVDGRNHLDPAELRAAGFAYEGIGRAASPFASLPETPEPERELLSE